MKTYLSYFKLKFKTGLQYRAAALAGISTQIFFGIVYISVYVAFYESDSSNLPMELSELVSYLWLNQCFFSLIYKGVEPVVHLASVRLGGDARDIKCDGSRSERTSRGAWIHPLPPEKRPCQKTRSFFNEIRLSASEIALRWNTLTRMKYLLRKC